MKFMLSTQSYTLHNIYTKYAEKFNTSKYKHTKRISWSKAYMAYTASLIK